MPTYTFEVDGQKYSVTADQQPTNEELLALVEQQKKLASAPPTEPTQQQTEPTQQQKIQRFTEQELIKNPNWIAASKKIYDLNEGINAVELDNDDQYANYGLRYMGWFNYNLPKMTLEATQLRNADDDQKKAFVELMDLYDAKKPSGRGFFRAVQGLATDPTTYAGISTFGAATAGAQAVKQGIKEGVKQATKAGLQQGAKIGALEGAAYTAADNALRQTARINAGEQQNFDVLQNAKSAAFGGAIGGGLGGSLGGFASNVAGRAQRAANQDAVTKQIQQEATQNEEATEVIYDWAEAITGQAPKNQTYSREIAEEARDNLVETTPDIQADINLGLSQNIIDTGVEILHELKIPRNPNVQISDQLFDAIKNVDAEPLKKGVFQEVLQRNNIKDPMELLQLFKIAASDSGRRLAQLSVAREQLQDIADELSANVPREDWASTALRKLGVKKENIYALDNLRRGLLVSQIATSMRNFTAQIGRVGIHTLTGVMDNALNQTFNPIRRLFGKETAPVDHTKSFKLFANLTTDVKKAKDITDLVTDHFVVQKNRLFINYASDIARATENKPFVAAQKMVDGLNTLNRMQEYFYRRGMFSASLSDTLAAKGIDINDVVEANDLTKITEADVAKAVDDALTFTYAKTPDNYFLKLFVESINRAPFLATGVLPFPRFMANALEFQFRHSPLGFTSLLSGKERAAIAKGDMKKLSQAMLGTSLLLGAIEAKRTGFGGEKWYELEGTDGTTIDARPYFPLTPYLLVADLVVRAEDGRIPPDARDLFQGLTGAQFRAGAGLTLVDNIINDLSGIESTEKLTKALKEMTSDVLGGYLTTFRMFNDFVDQQQEFRTAIPTGNAPFDIAQELGRSIPGLQQTFPEVQSPTRTATPGRPETVRIPGTNISVPGPLARQLTGITVREAKNIAEKELDRLGFKRRDILPYTGDKQADQIMAYYMGPFVEREVSNFVLSSGYQRLTNPEKELVMRKFLQKIRAQVKPIAEATDPARFAKIAYNRKAKVERKVLQQNNN